MFGLKQTFFLVLLFAFIMGLFIMVNIAIPKSSPRKVDRNLHYKFERADYPQLLNTNPGGVFKNLSWQLDSTQDAICDGNSSFILAVVPSSVGNIHERQLIRNSWGSKDIFLYTRLTTVFLVGATEDSVLQRKVVEEGFKYHDIIQMNYLDSYRNLTYKTMTALMWISENCQDIPWILKVDDDVLLNPFSLRVYLEDELAHNPSPSTIYGRLRPRSSPFRKGKWSVAVEEYPNKYYPRFVLGSAYIIGRNAIEKLIKATISSPFLHLEDVYFTGIVSNKAGIGLNNIEFKKFTRKATFTIISGNAIFLVGASASVRKHIWKKVLLRKPDLT